MHTHAVVVTPLTSDPFTMLGLADMPGFRRPSLPFTRKDEPEAGHPTILVFAVGGGGGVGRTC